MKLPKEISPDSIKDSIVEVRYYSLLPFEILLGLFFDSLDNTYTYTVRQVSKDKTTVSGPLFYNEVIKFEMIPNAIVFNCVDRYIGWEAYINEITKALTQLLKSNHIDYFSRIGIRYITEYQETELTDISNFSFGFGRPDVKSHRFNFKAEFDSHGLRTILNLVNAYPFAQGNDEPFVNLTTIDIDVITDKLEISVLDDLVIKMRESHLNLKTTFFSILKEDFIETLKPVY